jgi:hypothetical protein
MILGMTVYTFIHVVISLVAIAAGLLVLFGMLRSSRMDSRMDSMTLTFLLFTAATSLTGFGFPFHGITPAITLGIVSVMVLIPTFAARYAFGLRGAWRWIYILGAVLAQWLNSFVLVVQSFLKIPALHALAPKGSEPPFALAQGLVLMFYLVIGVLAVRRFKPAAG